MENIIFQYSRYIPYSCDAPPSSLMDSTWSPKVKTMEGKKIGARSLVRNISRVEGRAGASRWGQGILKTSNHSHGSTQTK